MIPKAYIDAWRSKAPWQQDAQVEQDLVISRALVEIFSNEFLSEHLAFRGETALHKLFFLTSALGHPVKNQIIQQASFGLHSRSRFG